MCPALSWDMTSIFGFLFHTYCLLSDVTGIYTVLDLGFPSLIDDHPGFAQTYCVKQRCTSNRNLFSSYVVYSHQTETSLVAMLFYTHDRVRSEYL